GPARQALPEGLIPMTRFATLPLLVLALTLAGCGGAKKQEGAGTAEGEVLPGSASDAMLPYDSVKSQPPLAPRSETRGEDQTGEAPRPTKAEAQPEAPTPTPATESPAAQAT
ncbi:MAG: hypothetical protein KGM49_06230, partial [Sphingomonadales bacterium]|nr:hypothetical protein [Sphingomonadales bacterium]